MVVKLLVAALVFLSLMFLGLIWLVAIQLKMSLLIPTAVTAMFVIIGLGIAIGRALMARKAAAGLEQGLREQAKAQAKFARPDLEPEIEAMQEEFDKAIGELKSSNVGKRGREALYYLPWYAIIGPPRAGKSTALRNSGLRFPYLSKQAGSVKGLGGTRNCDWWLTNEAVVLDTAGRWSTQEEDHDEWLAFLGLLKKHRPRKPLNGLITAISIGDVVNAKDDEVDELATRMRERIDEVIGQLNVSLPVYVLFTKCDLIEGFVEMFRDLRSQDRDQVWGFTASLAHNTGEPGKHFESRFDELSSALEGASMARIGEERKIESRQLIYAFPQQFAAMRHNLGRFVSSLFERNVYRETPAMRGVYFTSGTQEGRPFSLLLNRLAEAVGATGSVQVAEVVDQKSYFLRDVFQKVIFEDSEVASASQSALKKQRVQRLVLTSALAVFAVIFGLVPTYAWGRNRSQLRETGSLVDQWEHTAPLANAKNTDTDREDDKPEPVLFDRLKALQNVAQNLQSYSIGAPQWIASFGMYHGERVRPHLRRYYANLMRRELVEPIFASDMQAMADFGLKYASAPDRRPTAQEHSQYYALLKLHLLLTEPKASGEPALEPYKKWIGAQLAARWASSLAPDDAAQRKLAQDTADRYMQYATEYPELAFSRDPDMVKRTREALTRLPFARHALDRIIEKAAEEGYDLTLTKLIGHSGAIQSHTTIRGAFTRRGWENVVRDAMTPEALEHAGELWVLGLADRRDRELQVQAQLEELRSLYFRSYIEEWQNFIRDLRIETPNDNTAALALLGEMSRGQPPLIALLMHRTSYNLQLKPRPTVEGAIEGGAQKVLGAIKDKISGMLGDDDENKKKVDKLAKKIGQRGDAGEERTTPADVIAAFDGFVSFGVPPETDGEGPKPSVAYDVYQEQLVFLREALQMQMDNPEEKAQLLTRLQAARVRVRSLIEEQDPNFRPTFEALLWPPIEGAAVSSSRALAASSGRGWCNDVVVPFMRNIAGSYPFVPQGHDLSLDDFNTFYKPNDGILWRFTRESLGQTVQLDGDHFAFEKKLGKDASSVYADSLLEFLQRSRDITTVFWPQGSPAPRVDMEVLIHPSPMVAQTTFSIGGKTIEYHNGPETWMAMSWPGENPAQGAGFVIRGANGMKEKAFQEGAWGLFRMFESGTITRSSNRVFTVAWQLQTHDVTLRVDFKPVRSESPFFGVPGRSEKPRLLQPLRDSNVNVPKQIVRSGQPCSF